MPGKMDIVDFNKCAPASCEKGICTAAFAADPKPERAPTGFEHNASEDSGDFEDCVEPEIPDELYSIDPPFYEE